MTDLRTGLVEAAASQLARRRTPLGAQGDLWLLAKIKREAVRDATTVIDAALGFLTDNADQWFVSAGGMVLHGGDTGSTTGPNPTVTGLLAALSDSRDTGEKP